MLDEINVTTLKEIQPLVAQDNYFLGAPALMAMRSRGRFIPFEGGAEMQSNFLFRGTQTLAYRPGTEFVPVKQQLMASISHQPKYYAALLVEFLEDLAVINTGPNAVFSIIETDLAAAFMSLTSRIAVAWQQHGQNLGGTDDRSDHINGLPEALNDGVSPDYRGKVWTSYGSQLRSEVGAALNSTPRFVGDKNGNTGKIDYAELLFGYTDCNIGNAEPDLFVCSKSIWAHLANLMEPKQRVEMIRDPYYGIMGAIKFMNMAIMKDDLMLSAQFGQNADYGDFRTSTFAMPSGTIPLGFAKQVPAAAVTLTAGELGVMMNTNTWDVRIKNNQLFGGGFTGFLPSQTNTRVVGRVHLALNMRCRAPRFNKLYYGHGA